MRHALALSWSAALVGACAGTSTSRTEPVSTSQSGAVVSSTASTTPGANARAPACRRFTAPQPECPATDAAWEPGRPHPGTIAYCEADRLVASCPASAAPSNMYNGVPVVRVVRQQAPGGAHAEVFEYGPGGQLLRTTQMVRDPAP